MRAQSRGGCKASPANKKGGCEVDGASEPTCKAYPAIVSFTKNNINYKRFLTFVIITISVIPLCLCALNFAPPPLLCGSNFAPPYALRPQLCNPPFLCGGMFAPPVCFAPSTLHPPYALYVLLCTPPLLCALCSAGVHKILKLKSLNASLLAIVAVHTAENEPSQVGDRLLHDP